MSQEKVALRRIELWGGNPWRVRLCIDRYRAHVAVTVGFWAQSFAFPDKEAALSAANEISAITDWPIKVLR